MDNQEIIELEREIFKYHETPFHKKSDELMDEISTVFKNYGFIDKYLEYKRNEILKSEFISYISSVLLNLDEYARHDLNHMWAMLSDKNCWCVEYEVGKIVHEQLMRIWYPEDYTK